jgi:hypothetical protein
MMHRVLLGVQLMAAMRWRAAGRVLMIGIHTVALTVAFLGFIQSLVGQDLGGRMAIVQQQARLDAVERRVSAIESLALADRLARIEEHQKLTGQLQTAQLGGICGLIAEVLWRRVRRRRDEGSCESE